LENKGQKSMKNIVLREMKRKETPMKHAKTDVKKLLPIFAPCNIEKKRRREIT